MAKNLSLEEVEKKTKIRAKFLKALEENDHQKLPSVPYIRGFIENYSEFLGLSSEKVLAIFRRQFDEGKSLGLLPRGFTSLKKGPLSFNPRLTTLLFLLPLALLFIYLFREYRSFTQPPLLIIQSPQEEAVILGESAEISGQVDLSATLTLNGQKIFLQKDGTFTQKIDLTPGLNTLEFVATSKLGKETKVKRTVKVNP